MTLRLGSLLVPKNLARYSWLIRSAKAFRPTLYGWSSALYSSMNFKLSLRSRTSSPPPRCRCMFFGASRATMLHDLFYLIYCGACNWGTSVCHPSCYSSQQAFAAAKDGVWVHQNHHKAALLDVFWV
ncbi:hypothetical protein ACFX2A_008534 [Malus domestica]